MITPAQVLDMVRFRQAAYEARELYRLTMLDLPRPAIEREMTELLAAHARHRSRIEADIADLLSGGQ